MKPFNTASITPSKNNIVLLSVVNNKPTKITLEVPKDLKKDFKEWSTERKGYTLTFNWRFPFIHRQYITIMRLK